MAPKAPKVALSTQQKKDIVNYYDEHSGSDTFEKLNVDAYNKMLAHVCARLHIGYELPGNDKDRIALLNKIEAAPARAVRRTPLALPAPTPAPAVSANGASSSSSRYSNLELAIATPLQSNGKAPAAPVVESDVSDTDSCESEDDAEARAILAAQEARAKAQAKAQAKEARAQAKEAKAVKAKSQNSNGSQDTMDRVIPLPDEVQSADNNVSGYESDGVEIPRVNTKVSKEEMKSYKFWAEIVANLSATQLKEFLQLARGAPVSNNATLTVFYEYLSGEGTKMILNKTLRTGSVSKNGLMMAFLKKNVTAGLEIPESQSTGVRCMVVSIILNKGLAGRIIQVDAAERLFRMGVTYLKDHLKDTTPVMKLRDVIALFGACPGECTGSCKFCR